MTNALPGLFADFRLSICIPTLALWLKAGTNLRKWLRLLRFNFSSPYEVCFMEKKINEVGECHEKKMWALILDLKTKFLKSPHPQDCFGLQSAQQQHQQPFELSQHTADSHHSWLVFQRRSYMTVAVWPFHKGFGNAVSSLCFSFKTEKKKKKILGV